jgi:hypothetical protein
MKKKKFNPLYIFPIILGVIAVQFLVMIIRFSQYRLKKRIARRAILIFLRIKLQQIAIEIDPPIPKRPSPPFLGIDGFLSQTPQSGSLLLRGPFPRRSSPCWSAIKEEPKNFIEEFPAFSMPTRFEANTGRIFAAAWPFITFRQ